MEERAVLIVCEVIVDFLVPNHALPSRLQQPPQRQPSLFLSPAVPSTYRHIDHFQPESPSHQVIAEDSCPLQTSICPSRGIWVGYVESCDSYGKNLVGRLGDISLDGFLVDIAENRGHDELTWAQGYRRGRLWMVGTVLGWSRTHGSRAVQRVERTAPVHRLIG